MPLKPILAQKHRLSNPVNSPYIEVPPQPRKRECRRSTAHYSTKVSIPASTLLRTTWMPTLRINPQPENNMSDTQIEPTKALVPFGAKGVQLTTLEDAFRFATAVSKSGFAPKGVETPEAILIAVQFGEELGPSRCLWRCPARLAHSGRA